MDFWHRCFRNDVYCIVLYCIGLDCIVLYCIVLYCIVLYCIVSAQVIVLVFSSVPLLLFKKVVGCRRQWAGHIERMDKESMDKESMETEEGGRRRRGRPTLRCRDRVKRDLERSEVNSREWERTAGDEWQEMNGVDSLRGRNKLMDQGERRRRRTYKRQCGISHCRTVSLRKQPGLHTYNNVA